MFVRHRIWTAEEAEWMSSCRNPVTVTGVTEVKETFWILLMNFGEDNHTRLKTPNDFRYYFLVSPNYSLLMGRSVRDRQTDLPSANDREKLQIKMMRWFCCQALCRTTGPRYDLRIWRALYIVIFQQQWCHRCSRKAIEIDIPICGPLDSADI